jgi:transcriptional regulator with XRE-family HTH domain
LQKNTARGIQASMATKKERFGLAIQKRRKEVSLTTAELAELAGCSEANIRLIEKGSEPGVHRADAILEALELKWTIGWADGRKRLEV